MPTLRVVSGTHPILLDDAFAAPDAIFYPVELVKGTGKDKNFWLTSNLKWSVGGSASHI